MREALKADCEVQGKVKVLVAQSCPTLSNPMDCTCQAPLSTKFSRQEYWSGLNDIGVGSLLQRIFLTQGSNLGLLRCRQILYCLYHQGGPSSLVKGSCMSG